jgi:hypothetical protein
MTDQEYKRYLEDNVKPLEVIKSSKIKLERCPEHYLSPRDYYYTKVTDGYHRIQYVPTYKYYRSDIEKLRKKGLILVEKTDKLVIFKAEQENKQLTLFK